MADSLKHHWTDCTIPSNASRYNLTHGDLQAMNITLLTSCVVGAVSSLLAISFIVVSRAYRNFIHRLFLYLSFTALVLSCAYISDTIMWIQYIQSPEETKVTYVKIFLDYLILVFSVLICWIAVYVFSLAVFRVELKRPRHELTGVLLAVLLPAVASGLMCVVFPLTDLQTNTYITIVAVFLFVSILPFLLSALLTAMSLVAVLLALHSSEDFRIHRRHRAALKEAAILLVFSVVQLLVGSVVFAFYLYYFLIILLQSCILWYPFVEFVMFVPCAFVCLPILLLCQRRVRGQLTWRNFGKQVQHVLVQSSSQATFEVPHSQPNNNAPASINQSGLANGVAPTARRSWEEFKRQTSQESEKKRLLASS